MWVLHFCSIRISQKTLNLSKDLMQKVTMWYFEKYSWNWPAFGKLTQAQVKKKEELVWILLIYSNQTRSNLLHYLSLGRFLVVLSSLFLGFYHWIDLGWDGSLADSAVIGRRESQRRSFSNWSTWFDALGIRRGFSSIRHFDVAFSFDKRKSSLIGSVCGRGLPRYNQGPGQICKLIFEFDIDYL